MTGTLAAAITLALAASTGPDRGAVLRSAVLPGWGQSHLGHGTRAAVFMGVEAATWIGAGLSYLEGTFSEDDFGALALSEAGLDVDGLDGDYLDDVADFGSSQEFNDYIRRLARYYYPDDPVAQQQYYEQHSREDGPGWSWSSESAREEFSDALRESREWYRRALYIGMFAVVNRAVSAIDAALLDPADPGLYSAVEFPEAGDFASVRMVVGTRF